MVPKLLAYIANIVEPFLVKYQTDNPTIPLLYFDLKEIIIKLLEIIVKPDVLEKCKSWQKLKDLDLSLDKNLLTDEKLNAGFAVANILHNLKRKDLIKSYQTKEFLKMAKNFIVSMVEKLHQKSLLNSPMIRATSVFDPTVLIELPKQKLIDRLKTLLGNFMNLKILTPQQCDLVLSQFKDFMDIEIKAVKLESFKSTHPKNRLDDFYYQHACISNYKEMSFVVRLVLTLSHVQAAVERGFSINNTSVKTNMTPVSIISRRIIKDHLIANQLKPHTVHITASLIKSFRSARQAYMIELDNAKKEKEKTEEEQKAMHITADIEKLNQKIKTAKKAIEMMEKEVTECMELAEKKNDLNYVKKANGLKRKSSETKQEVELLEKQIGEFEKKKKELLS